MAKGKTDARTPIGLKNTKNTTDKLELNKYCPKCKSVQVFKEAKIGK